FYGNGQQQNGATVERVDMGKALKEQISVIKDLLSVTQDLMPAVQQTPPPVANDPATAPAFIEMKTRLEMMERMAGMDPEKQGFMIKMLDKMFPEDPDAGLGWSAIIKGALSELPNLLASIPMIIQMVKAGGVPAVGQI